MKTVNLKDGSFHFIGIGGIGMSGLAYILAKRDFFVSGSDLSRNHIIQRLESVGAYVFPEQRASNLEFLVNKFPAKQLIPQIIWSTAISNHNSEYQAALAQGFPLFHRSDLLAALIKDYQSIAVSGTHGKTTTSSLIGYLLMAAGLDPTIIVGGEVTAWEGNARLGASEFLVAEADESDGSLTKHHPQIGIITNIELDHPDHYKDLTQLTHTFSTFAQQCHLVIGCLDCQMLKRTIKPDISYSLNPDSGADYIARNIRYQDKYSEAEIWEKGNYLGSITLQIPGEHNISNALGAIAVGRYLGLAAPVIIKALGEFTGAKRRFEIKGDYQGAILVDDYAHHPSEIIATLQGASLQVEQKCYQRIIAIFQPHRYSRTQTFLQEFAQAFSKADIVIVTDIYSAGENNPQKITGELVAMAIRQYHGAVIYHPELTSLATYLQQILQPGDLALFLGAGNLNQSIPQLLETNHAHNHN